jgi:hypothetical protein
MAFGTAGGGAHELRALSGAADRRAPDAEQSASSAGATRGLDTMPRHQLLRTLETSLRGLTETEADERAAACGENAVPAAASAGRAARVLAAARSPFVLLLAGLALVAAQPGGGLCDRRDGLGQLRAAGGSGTERGVFRFETTSPTRSTTYENGLVK